MAQSNTATPKARSTKSAAKAAPAPKLPLGKIALTVAEPDLGPVREVTIAKDKVIGDVDGILEHLGLVKAIKTMEKPMVDEVKRLLIEQGAHKIESVHYVGTLHAGSGAGVKKVIDPARFLKLCKKRDVGADKLAAAITVDEEQVTFLTPDDLATCMVEVPTPGSTGRLDVDPRKDAPLQLQDAIKTFADEATKDRVKVPTKSK